jgi:hypothetical protein
MALKLTKAVRAKRVAVMEDILVRLAARKLHLKRGSYMARSDRKFATSKRAEREIAPEDQLQECVDDIEKACDVCLMGAVLLSYIRLYNKVTAEAVTGDDLDSYELWELSTGYDEIRQVLRDVFTPADLGVIEAVFEGRVTFLEMDGFDFAVPWVREFLVAHPKKPHLALAR